VPRPTNTCHGRYIHRIFLEGSESSAYLRKIKQVKLSLVKFPLAVTAFAVAGELSTLPLLQRQPSTSPESSTASSMKPPGDFSQDGDYAVGPAPRGELQAVIPLGRYRAEFQPNVLNLPGVVARCSDYQCGANSENWIDFVPGSPGDSVSRVAPAPPERQCPSYYASRGSVLPRSIPG
jgi:hypothetical protein